MNADWFPAPPSLRDWDWTGVIRTLECGCQVRLYQGIGTIDYQEAWICERRCSDHAVERSEGAES